MRLLKPREIEGRTKLTPYQWQKRRFELHSRAGGFCEKDKCHSWTPLNEGHAHHIQRRGLGGGKRDDSLSNLLWLCENCHVAEHAAGGERKGGA